MDYQFNRQRIDKIPREKMLEELEKVAIRFAYVEFGWRDFDKFANISANPIKKEFGCWKNALAVLKNYLAEKGIDFSPRKVPPNRIHSDNDLFNEMERIWQKVGQRPSRTEWEISEPKIAYNTYKQRFGSWTKACHKFIEYKIGNEILNDDFVLPDKEDLKLQQENKAEYKKEESRNISLSLRLAVLYRDNFRCVFCGKSPATDVGTKLHIDHIEPFSKGGKSILENLQTLCEECNLGKSDRVVINMVN